MRQRERVESESRARATQASGECEQSSEWSHSCLRLHLASPPSQRARRHVAGLHRVSQLALHATGAASDRAAALPHVTTTLLLAPLHTMQTHLRTHDTQSAATGQAGEAMSQTSKQRHFSPSRPKGVLDTPQPTKFSATNSTRDTTQARIKLGAVKRVSYYAFGASLCSIAV